MLEYCYAFQMLQHSLYQPCILLNLCVRAPHIFVNPLLCFSRLCHTLLALLDDSFQHCAEIRVSLIHFLGLYMNIKVSRRVFSIVSWMQLSTPPTPAMSVLKQSSQAVPLTR